MISRSFAITAGLALLLGIAPGCRHRRRRPSARATAAPPPSLFAGTATATHRTRWLDEVPLGESFVTAIDGTAAVLAHDGRLRWVSARNGVATVSTIATPCRFTPAQHTRLWTTAPRVALDGAAHTCCIHEGDNAAAAGAYCATLAHGQPVRFRRARTPTTTPPEGAGSGDGAIALFARDVWCTTDAGESMRFTFRGDLEQGLSSASCTRAGDAVAVGGARGPGSRFYQTVRSARLGGPLTLVASFGRGEPIDLRAMLDGSVRVILAGAGDARLSVRDPSGAVANIAVDADVPLAIGAWASSGALWTSRGRVGVRWPVGREVERIVDPALPVPFATATRVGNELVGVARDGTMLVLSHD